MWSVVEISRLKLSSDTEGMMVLTRTTKSYFVGVESMWRRRHTSPVNKSPWKC